MDETSKILESMAQSVNAFNTIVLQSKPWILIQSFAAPFIGTMLGAGLAFGSNYFFQWLKERSLKKKQHTLELRRLNSTFLGLNNNIDKLLTFKAEILTPYYTQLESQQTQEMKQDNNNESEFSLLLLPLLVFDETLQFTKLEFIANEKPILLDPLQHAHNYLVSVNYYIKVYNKVIVNFKQEMLQGTSNEKRQTILEMLYFYIQTLAKNIDAALWFMQFSIECLKKFAEEYYLDQKVLEEKIATKYDNLMPPSEYNKKYAESIRKAAAY